jgi:hypothetical protein
LADSQNAEKISAKTPKNIQPKRRKIICQNAEKLFAKTPKNVILIVR